MINRFNMDSVQAFTEKKPIGVPKGGYVCQILGTHLCENEVGQYLELYCDVAEGKYKDTYINDYRAQTGDRKKWHCIAFINVPTDDGSRQDESNKRAFMCWVRALEGSNPGYHFDWDETKLKGLKIGGLFNNKQWRGRDGIIRDFVQIGRWETCDNVRSGNYRMPKDKVLRDSQAPTVTIPDLPF